jgi:hypothetical protein
MASPRPAAVDTAKLQAFMDKMVGDMSAAMSGALVLIGDKLGLYRSLATDGAATSAELAERTETAERYVREWLAAQAAAGYVAYDKRSGRFSMTPEQGDGACPGIEPRLCRRRVRGDRGDLSGRAEGHGRLPQRQGHRLARAP